MVVLPPEEVGFWSKVTEQVGAETSVQVMVTEPFSHDAPFSAHIGLSALPGDPSIMLCEPAHPPAPPAPPAPTTTVMLPEGCAAEYVLVARPRSESTRLNS